jgi:hypothetical protein
MELQRGEMLKQSGFAALTFLLGGSEVVMNWIALGGAVGPMKMTLVDYVAGYRSMPSTGCGMAFAYWTQA